MIEWIDTNLLNFPNQPIPMVWIGYNFWNVCKVQKVLLAVWSLELSETIQEIFPLEIQLFCVSLHFQILFGEERRNLANVVSVILTLQWNGEWESLQSYLIFLCHCGSLSFLSLWFVIVISLFVKDDWITDIRWEGLDLRGIVRAWSLPRLGLAETETQASQHFLLERKP